MSTLSISRMPPATLSATGKKQEIAPIAPFDRERGRHYVAGEPSRRREGFPKHHDGDDDRNAQRGHRAQWQPPWLGRRQRQSTGLSHRSNLSVRMNTQMLTRITKQIAAYVPA